MKILQELINLYNLNKDILNPFGGLLLLLLGSGLTYFITILQVKKNNKFALAKEIKLELQNSFDKLYRLIIEANILINEYYETIEKLDYKNARKLIDDTLFLINEITQTKNLIDSNYSLLVFIFKRNEWTLELKVFLKPMNSYLQYLNENIYTCMKQSEFHSGDYVESEKYIELLEDYLNVINHEEYKEWTREIFDFDIRVVISYLNAKLAELAR